MNVIPVFRKGLIINYDKIFADLSWSYEELLEASSFYAACIIESIPEQLAYTLSYIFVMMKKHPNMFFEKTHIHMIESLLIRVSRE